MKKIILLFMCMALAIGGVCVAKDKKVEPENLPVAIRDFVKQNFPKMTITAASQELDDKDYSVILSNGTTLEFGKGFRWSEIYNKKGVIPANLLPRQIVAYAKQKYPHAVIVRIERCSQGYDIDLNNRKHFQLSTEYKPTKFKEAD